MFDVLESVLPFLPAFLGAAIGGLITNHFASRCDEKTIKREVALKYIVEAVDIVDSANSARQDADIKNLEKAVNRIQIFGSKNAIIAAEEHINNLRASGNSSANRLLNTLRDDIRSDLSLEKSTVPFFYVAFRKD